MRRWLAVLAAELPLLRDLPDVSERPRPRVTADLGPSVPGWAVRLAAVVVATALVTAAAGRTTMAEALAWGVILLAAGAMAVFPSGAVAHLATAAGGVLVAVGGHGPFDPVVFGLIPLAFLTAHLARRAEGVGLTARVEVAALVRGLGRGLAFTAATLGFGALAFVLTGHPNPLAVVAGGAALVVLTWLLFVRLPPAARG